MRESKTKNAMSFMGSVGDPEVQESVRILCRFKLKSLVTHAINDDQDIHCKIVECFLAKFSSKSFSASKNSYIRKSCRLAMRVRKLVSSSYCKPENHIEHLQFKRSLQESRQGRVFHYSE